MDERVTPIPRMINAEKDQFLAGVARSEGPFTPPPNIKNESVIRAKRKGVVEYTQVSLHRGMMMITC